MALTTAPTLFDRFFVDFDRAFVPRAGSARPPMDVVAYEDRLELVADLPGLSRDDVDLEVADGVLTVRADRALEVPEQGRVVRRERSARTFSRSFALGDEVDVDAIGATMRDGVLRITLPKSERAKPRQIEVAVN
jgi:HSP20 family protein